MCQTFGPKLLKYTLTLKIEENITLLDKKKLSPRSETSLAGHIKGYEKCRKMPFSNHLGHPWVFLTKFKLYSFLTWFLEIVNTFSNLYRENSNLYISKIFTDLKSHCDT